MKANEIKLEGLRAFASSQNSQLDRVVMPARGRTVILLIAVLFLIKAATFAWLVTPLWTTPDETGHYSFVEDLANGHYPLLGQAMMSRDVTDAWTGPGTTPAPNWIAQHPPLFYALDAPVLMVARAAGLDFEQQVRSARMLSAVFGALTLVGLAYFIFRATGSLELSVACEVFLSATPMFLHLSSGVTHDTLLACTGAWAAERYVRWINYDNFNDARLAAVFLALGTITKITALALAVPMVGLMALRIVIHRDGWRARARNVLSVGVLAFLPTSIWMLRNALIFGNPLVDSSILSSPTARVPIGLWDFMTKQPFWQQTMINYVGLIGWSPHGALDWIQVSRMPLLFFVAAGIVGCWKAVLMSVSNGGAIFGTDMIFSFIATLGAVYMIHLFDEGQIVAWFCVLLGLAVTIQAFVTILPALAGDKDKFILFSSATIVLFFSALYLERLWHGYDGSLRATHGRYFYPVLPFAFLLLAESWRSTRSSRAALSFSIFALAVCDGFYLSQVYKFYGQIH